MLERHLDNAARFRLLTTQLKLSMERAAKAEAAAAAAGVPEYAAHVDPAITHPVLDQFILNMLHQFLVDYEDPLVCHWEVDQLDPPELRELIQREGSGKRYITLYADARSIKYEFSDQKPDQTPNPTPPRH